VGRTLKPIGGVRPRPLFSADAFPTSSANAATPRIVSIIIRGPARAARCDWPACMQRRHSSQDFVITMRFYEF
jgi:hypothetical protein